MSDLLLPPGTRLLHIGPHKTGTTALQIALGKNREAMLKQGVRYVWGGEHLNANLAALAVAKRPTRRFSSAKPVPIEHWTTLVEKVTRALSEERIMISGEEFCSANEATIEQIVRELLIDRIHILITLRPLERIMASQWQQYVQAGSVTLTIDDWTKRVLENDPRDDKVREFWVRHNQERLVQRWISQVGKERVSILVLDDGDRGYLYRKVEELLGLSVGTLVTDERLVNRSMTLQEAEAVRSMYVLLNDLGLGELSDHVRFMISPSEEIKRHRTPHAQESRITVPEWALTEVRDLGKQMADAIKREGVRVIGELEWLAVSREPGGDSQGRVVQKAEAPMQVPVDLAGWIAYGVIQSSGISRGDLPPAPTSTLPFSWLRRATGPQLLREVARRTKIRLTQPLDWLRHRGKGRIDE